MTNITKQTCRHCYGTGLKPDLAKIGAERRTARIALCGPRSLTAVARIMGIRAPYLWDMERGGRGFSIERLAAHKAACLRVQKERTK